MINKEVDLSVSCYGKVKGCMYDLVILPWGATEPHNLHLPYLTDCILSHDVAVEAALLAKQMYDIHCMVMPAVTMGSQNPGQRELPFCIHTRYETQKAILTDIVASLYAQGVRKLVIVNGHGGNTFKSMIRDLSVDYPDFLIASSEWFTVLKAGDFFEDPGDHADELETSVMMYYHPELVNLQEAGKGDYKKFAIRSLNEKVAWIPRDWSKVSEDTGIGNPCKASAAKGERFAKAVAEKYAKLFEELVNREIYPQ
ncbi:putative mycofactocin system creatinine amidohydrolase family protein MftE [Bacteroides pyogenes]|nr:creatininase family protein [Bacteroides pyogenes]MBR8724045.1 putative mycofactocin system creatinine amidohydrolase family protein MftE [Bacteroides pyogenes]MBR8737594.1 putative mycofactocin system creatinine amidohydrolase family protein MftE [Bacteroides pyogenes]MBR8753169.1 putative mycofactocin system creatinine amidohydrolase family protein MftE [Bacteroides pyogenes]MBR8794455.1 putative mycofactocin system creatinine amidohydrolase family protein MftE [Bacteroides pyogenes]MBR88